MLKPRTPALKERLDIIVNTDEKLSKNWMLKISN
jgi:hypothetical protein